MWDEIRYWLSYLNYHLIARYEISGIIAEWNNKAEPYSGANQLSAKVIANQSVYPNRPKNIFHLPTTPFKVGAIADWGVLRAI
jgi:hypothetical protein